MRQQQAVVLGEAAADAGRDDEGDQHAVVSLPAVVRYERPLGQEDLPLLLPPHQLRRALLQQQRLKHAHILLRRGEGWTLQRCRGPTCALVQHRHHLDAAKLGGYFWQLLDPSLAA